MEQGAICLAVYRPDLPMLNKQIQSLKGQTLENWKCIIGVDGEGTVNPDVLEDIIGDDERFEIHYFAENLGHYRNFERIITLAKGHHWIALCDQDDYWYPKKLELLVRELFRPGIVAATSQAMAVSKSGKVISQTNRRGMQLNELLVNNDFTGCFSAFLPSVAEVALPFPKQKSASFHDHWLAVCSAALGEISLIEKPLLDYTQHESNVTGEEVLTPVLGGALKLRVQIGSIRKMAWFITTQRWGWRVEMASTLVGRTSFSPTKTATLAAFSRGVINLALLKEFVGVLTLRHVPVRRVVSNAVGATFWRFQK